MMVKQTKQTNTENKRMSNTDPVENRGKLFQKRIIRNKLDVYLVMRGQSRLQSSLPCSNLTLHLMVQLTCTFSPTRFIIRKHAHVMDILKILSQLEITDFVYQYVKYIQHWCTVQAFHGYNYYTQQGLNSMKNKHISYGQWI